MPKTGIISGETTANGTGGSFFEEWENKNSQFMKHFFGYQDHPDYSDPIDDEEAFMATLTEAQKLARHTDIKQTMKYTHIGIDDQAKAVSNLPLLHICCISDGSDRYSESLAVSEERSKNDATPGDSEGCDGSCHLLALGENLQAAGFPGFLTRCRLP